MAAAEVDDAVAAVVVTSSTAAAAAAAARITVTSRRFLGKRDTDDVAATAEEADVDTPDRSIDQLVEFLGRVRAEPGYEQSAAGEWIGVGHAFEAASFHINGRTYRRHEAYQVDAFVAQHLARAAAPPDTPVALTRVYDDELIPDPARGGGDVKFFLDLDVCLRTNPGYDGDAMQAAVLACIGRAAGAARLPGALRLAVFDASVTGVKFSRHIIASNWRAHDVCHWAALVACSGVTADAVVPHVWDAAHARRATPVDVGVHARRRLFRLPGSSKREDPTRVLRPADGARLTAPLLRRALLSACFDADAVTFVPSPLELATCARPSPAVSSIAAGAGNNQNDPTLPREVAALLDEFIAQLATAGRGGRGRYRACDGSLLVNVPEHTCPFKGAAHRMATIYHHVDVFGARYRTGCHSRHCARRFTAWMPLPARASTLARDYAVRVPRPRPSRASGVVARVAPAQPAAPTPVTLGEAAARRLLGLP